MVQFCPACGEATNQSATVMMIGTLAILRVIGLMDSCGRPVRIVAGVLATQKAFVLKHPLCASIDLSALVKTNAPAFITKVDRAKLEP